MSVSLNRALVGGLALLAALLVGCSSHPATPAPTHHASPTQQSSPASNSIPQNNGGDHDADNNGGPSDGDGNL